MAEAWVAEGSGQAAWWGVAGWLGAELRGGEVEGVGGGALDLRSWVVGEETQSAGEGSARRAGGFQLVDRADDIHNAAFPDFADEFRGVVGNEVRWTGLNADFRYQDRAFGLCLGLVLRNDFFDPGCFACDIEVVRSILDTGFYYGGSVEMVRANCIENDFGLLG